MQKLRLLQEALKTLRSLQVMQAAKPSIRGQGKRHDIQAASLDQKKEDRPHQEDNHE